MALKDEWKNTGKSFGAAFGGLGKNVVRSVKTGVDIVDAELDSSENATVSDSTVFNDGSWRQTGKDIGGAFVNLGKSIVKSAKAGIDKVDDKIENEE